MAMTLRQSFIFLPLSNPVTCGKVPGGLLGKRLSSRHSPQPPLSKTWCQGKEAVGAAGALGPWDDVCLSRVAP